ncbi:MAG: 2-amino-4-hydroxy-6-hydroxymethyldihydropteridine diphosphokinase [Puniceicoccales bacterium]|jgi:2-amino-4-hydroxy-6-hydroxymethyldihydropteridine diphosphokinase|nr:2-amino-4-hydroxy-6-hydroxymethyldihydropteridine diphosphokinase [Puniceicoccales bacterium]
MKNNAYLSIGSNLGDRLRFIESAIEMLKMENMRVEKFSSVYETEPQNVREQPKFLNCVLGIETDIDAHQLLEVCKKIEKIIGKNKTIAFGPRNIDIDILTFNDENILSPTLVIPHPRMHERNFVLTPLKEIAPDFKVNGQLIDALLERCSDQSVVHFKKTNYSCLA